MQRAIAFLLLCFGLFAQPFQLNDPAFMAATRPKGSSTPWSPTNVSGLKLWLKADVGAYTDSSKTTPCTDGTRVCVIADQSGNGNDFVALATTNQPFWWSSTSNRNGHAIMDFGNGSANWNNSMTNGMVISSGNKTFFVVGEVHSTSASGQSIFDSHTGRLIVSPVSTATAKIGYFDGTAWREATYTWGADYHAGIWQLNSAAASANIYVDGTAVGSGMTYTAKAIGDASAICGLYNGTSGIYFNFCEMGIYDSDIGSTQIANLQAYLKARWGTP